MSRRRASAAEKGKGVASSSEAPQIRQTVLEPGDPRFFGVQLRSDAQLPTCLQGELGGASDSYYGIFVHIQARRLKNGTPRRISFQLGGQRREMTVEELDALFNGRSPAYYVGDQQIHIHQFWTKLAWMHEEKRQFYNSQQSQATSIKNPAIRYLHRLLTCTIFARDHMSKVQSTDMTVISAALELKSMFVGCFLADHFEAQQELSGKAKIFCGGMITPIAILFGVNTDEPPVSLDIFLDRRTITGMGMLKTGDRLLWILKQRTGTRLFPMPNPPLTVLFGDDGSFNEDNLTMIMPDHITATIADFLTPRAARARGQPVESDSDEEMAEEETEYESGGDEAWRSRELVVK